MKPWCQHSFAGSEAVASAVVDIWQAQHSKVATEKLQLQDLMLLTCIGYWLAAGADLQAPQDIHSAMYTPWLPEQEVAIKVQTHFKSITEHACQVRVTGIGHSVGFLLGAVCYWFGHVHAWQAAQKRWVASWRKQSHTGSFYCL